MKAVQSAFPRAKDKIHFKEGGERKIYLVLLQQFFCTTCVWNLLG